MAVISFPDHRFLTHDKTNSFPERLFGWRDMADKFPRRVAVFAFLTSSPIQVTGHGFSAVSGYQAINCLPSTSVTSRDADILRSHWPGTAQQASS